MKGSTAIITGSSGGIGGAIADALAAEGADVILFGGKNAEKLNAAEKRVKEFGVKAKAFQCDLTDDEEVKKTFLKAMEIFGKADILINNAGMAYNAPFEKTEQEIFDKIMNINFRAPVFLTRLALPYLKKSQNATIINIASVVAHRGYPLQSAYTASKHALLGFTKSLAVELYKENVRVHAISPGGVYTDMIKIARPDLTGEGMITPKDVADIALFLLKHRTNAVIDEISLHRVGKEPFL